MCTFHCEPKSFSGVTKPGKELGDVMVARAGQHAEAPEQLEPHPVVVDHVGLVPPLARRDLLVLHRGGRIHPHRLARRALGIVEQVAQLRERVVAVGVVQLGDERQVVHAADDRVELPHVGVEQQAHHVLHADQLVAEPDGLHLRLRVTARHSAVSGLDTLMKKRVGAHGLDVARDVEHDGDAAQRAHHAAGPDGVADGLAHPVTLGDLEVVRHALETADREARDHVVGAFERAPAIGLRT